MTARYDWQDDSLMAARTCEDWPAAGPDYVARLGAAPPEPETGV
ncbi:MAG: hypothetical protein AAF366_03530 [Pseudomonadota bacterium]